MRLRLFRGRIRWPARDQRGQSAGDVENQAPAQQSRESTAHPGGFRGTHRKAGRIRGRTAPGLTTTADRPSAGQAARPERDTPGARDTPAAGADGTPAQSGTSPQSGTPVRGGPRGAARTGATRPGQANRPAHAAGRTQAPGSARGAARAAIRIAPEALEQAAPAAIAPSTATSRQVGALGQAAGTEVAQPWYATARPGRSAAGQRNCGCLEEVLVREWAADQEPAPEAVTAINRLAALPLIIKEKLTAGLNGIHVGSGGVPDLDHMGELAGVALPSGRATWDACAGAYGDRKIVVGSRPSPTPDVMCHEVGHALDDIDGAGGQWQSDSGDFRGLYTRCLPHMASQFHRHGGSLGRREFFADAFAAIASSQRPALVEMLSGDTRTALDVMLYFNVRYGM